MHHQWIWVTPGSRARREGGLQTRANRIEPQLPEAHPVEPKHVSPTSSVGKGVRWRTRLIEQLLEFVARGAALGVDGHLFDPAHAARRTTSSRDVAAGAGPAKRAGRAQPASGARLRFSTSTAPRIWRWPAAAAARRPIPPPTRPAGAPPTSSRGYALLLPKTDHPVLASQQLQPGPVVRMRSAQSSRSAVGRKGERSSRH